MPACPTCRESGPEGQTLMFATMAITEASCSECRDWIRSMEALELGYPGSPRSGGPERATRRRVPREG